MSGETESSPKTEPVKNATSTPWVFVDGVRFPRYFETNRPLPEHVRCIKALEMRDNDVIVCAFPKCGTHWMWEIASMLTSGKAEYEKRAKEYAMMDAVEIESLQSQPSPRILNTHIPVSMLPAQVQDKKVKVIHIYRNLKDVAVSLSFHFKQNRGNEKYSVDDALEDWISNQGKGNYIPYLQAMNTFIEENPNHPIFNVSYEELKEDPEGTVRRLGEFLGVKTTPELCADIARATSFINMKEADRNKMHLKHLPRRQMYRKGVVGDWKNHMTVGQSEAADAIVAQLQGCSNLYFRYTL